MKLSTLTAVARRAYSLLIWIASFLQSPLLLVVRLYWGWQFVGTGMAKFGDIPAFAQRFADWGIPAPQLNVILAATAETACGFLLCIGLASRLVSIPLIVTMIVAYLTAESEAVRAIFSDPDKFVTATPFLFLFASVLVLIFGPGALSLDWILARKFAPPSPPQNANPNAAPTFAQPASCEIAK